MLPSSRWEGAIPAINPVIHGGQEIERQRYTIEILARERDQTAVKYWIPRRLVEMRNGVVQVLTMDRELKRAVDQFWHPLVESDHSLSAKRKWIRQFLLDDRRQRFSFA